MRARKYTWAAGDRLVSIADEGHGGCEYGYDARGALVQAEHTDGRVELRATDDVGNLFETLAGADREYGLTGELLKRTGSDGVTTYRYDAEGNLAERRDPDGGVWLYHWDDAGTLAQVDRPDGTAVAMQYDALGRRVAKNHRGRRTRWLWDGDVKLHEWQESAEAPEVRLTPEEQARVRFLERSRELFPQLYGDGWEQRWDVLLADDGEAPRSHAVVRARLNPADPPEIDPTVITWLHEPGTFTPLARITKESAHAIVADHLGTPLAVLEDAELRTQLVTDTNGRAEITGDAALCPFRFPGHYFDEETELHENRFRHYDPATGRYLSRDPLGLRGGLGAYAYVRNPTTWTDPLGLAAKPAAGAGCEGGGLQPHPADRPDLPGGHRGRYQAAAHHGDLPRLPQDWDVHHSIPQTLRGDPRLSGIDIDSPIHTRGVPGSRAPQNIHQDITNEWNAFLDARPDATRAELLAFRDDIDRRYGSHFWENQSRPE